MSLREFAKEVVLRLRGAGHEAYWAGGCVRDLLLRKSPKDFDVATSARPRQVQALFPRTIPVGVSFGVVRVLGPQGQVVEVATFRCDDQYSDGRRPDSVRFSTAQEDAQRRDFTINGMFLDPVEERILDFVGGQADLDARVLRAIGDPRQRFTEDKLRLLRAVRFAARFDFQIDVDSARAISEFAPQLEIVSAERILAEMRQMLEAPTRVVALGHLWETGLWPIAVRELAELGAAGQCMTNVKEILGWPGATRFPLVIAGLFSTTPDVTAPKLADELLLRWKATNEDREHTRWLLTNRRSLRSPQTKRDAPIKRLLVHPAAPELIALTSAMERAETRSDADARRLRERIALWSAGEINPPPILRGEDLMALGMHPGPAFRTILDTVREKQLNGELTTTADALQFVATLQTSLPGG